MKKSMIQAAAVAFLLCLLWKPQAAFAGASAGLLLWSQTVLPTLLPFMICSNLIVSLDAVSILTFPFRPLLRCLLKLSDSGSYILISGILCGYPMGAKTCSEFLDSHRISRKEGAYLLAICNHASPMFLLGYTAASITGPYRTSHLLLAIYLPVFLIALAARRCYDISSPPVSHETGRRTALLSFDQMLMSSIEVIVKIGGYIMLFSILAEFIRLLPLSSWNLRSLILGFVEITTGIRSLSVHTHGLFQALSIVTVTAFGGLSGLFQTKSVLKNAGLSIRHYLGWKLLHCFLSCIMFLLLVWLFPAAR